MNPTKQKNMAVLLLFITCLTICYVVLKEKKLVMRSKHYYCDRISFAKEHNWFPTYQSVAIPKKTHKNAGLFVKYIRREVQRDYIESLKDINLVTS